MPSMRNIFVYARSSRGVTLLTAIALLVNSAASIASTTILPVQAAYALAAAISLLVIAMQLQVSRPYVVQVNPGEWTKGDDASAHFMIAAHKHRKGKHPSVKFEMRERDSSEFSQVLADVKVDAEGSVTIAGYLGDTQHVSRITVT